MENQNSLTHWGILGMKWGIRRYRNRDGTLTDAGKKRYTSEIVQGKKKVKIKNGRIDLTDMSDKELRQLIYRLRLEQSYNQLYHDFVNPPRVEKGRIDTEKIMNSALRGMDATEKIFKIMTAINRYKQSRPKSSS